MIIRIVKMEFRSDAVSTFLQLFEERKQLIRSFEGCQHLELWHHATVENIFFTYSHWESEQALDKYRFSALFKDTWAKTRILFSEKPEAWSVNQSTVVTLPH